MVSSVEMQQWNKRIGEFKMEIVLVWSNVLQLSPVIPQPPILH